MSLPVQRSYHVLPPLESGGPIARRGYAFQDHVAVGYCIQLLADDALVAVWCETLDDITLVWSNDGCERFEFVQAKSAEFDQLWSITLLCKRPKSAGPKPARKPSIVERSLQLDRADEPCQFRVVTSVGFKRELRKLCLPLTSPERAGDFKGLSTLRRRFERSLRGHKPSDNGHTVEFWLRNVVLEHVGDEAGIKAKNRLALQALVEGIGACLTGPQLESVYDELMKKVVAAGKAPWAVDPEEKKLKKDDLLSWLRLRVTHAGAPAMTAGETLRAKMKKAKIPDPEIKSAVDFRIRYRTHSLDSGYMDFRERQRLEDAARATLHRLRTRLLEASPPPTGPKFLAQCCDQLARLARDDHALSAYLYGLMYDVTERCQHRFVP